MGRLGAGRAGRRGINTQGLITGVPLTSQVQKTPAFPGLFVESTRYRPGLFASKSARIDPPQFPLWVSRYRNGAMAGMALTNAERQRRFPGAPRRRQARPHRRTPKDRRPRPKQWTDAVAVLRRLQGEYEAWRDGLPESLADSRTAELLEGVCDVDLDALDVELPRGFGRD